MDFSIKSAVSQQSADMECRISPKLYGTSSLASIGSFSPFISVFLQTNVEAPKTQALYNLQVRVSELPQLKQSKHRFNAFILGLLK